MLQSIEFENFKALRNCVLPLGRVTVLVGPNGCGKTSVLQACEFLQRRDFVSDIWTQDQDATLKTKIRANAEFFGETAYAELIGSRSGKRDFSFHGADTSTKHLATFLSRVRVFDFRAEDISAFSPLGPGVVLTAKGQGLPSVLDSLRDKHGNRFAELTAELSRWLPEFSEVTFESNPQSQKQITLVRKANGAHISAHNLSQGTLLALAMLTLAYLPDPPTFVGLEHPDIGIHPRLLRRVQDAIYRIAYPEDFGETRPPVQVILTTHSPFLLDWFKEHPDEIVIADKGEQGVSFSRLSDRTQVDQILPGGALGDLWYSGLLGGVPAES